MRSCLVVLGDKGYGRINRRAGNSLSRKLNEKEHEPDKIAEARFVLDLNGVITSVNSAACCMLDEEADSLVGMKIGDVFEEEDVKQAQAFLGTWLEALIMAGALEKIEASYVAKDGSRMPILFSRSVLRDDQDEVCAIVCVANKQAKI
jgi:PAS domain S-box-containing protein